MKKTFISTILATSALMLNAQSPATMPLTFAPIYDTTEDASTLEFGYCGDMYQAIGWSNVEEVTLRGVIQIPQEISERYKGATISKVLVGLGDANFADSSVFIMQGLEDDEAVYEQETDFVESSWNEVALAEPYTLDGDEIFVGYQTTAASKTGVGVFAIVVDSEAANLYGDYIGTFDGSSWNFMHLSEAGLGNVCIRLVLSGDNLPQYDLELQNIVVKEYLRTGDEFSIKGTVKNSGIRTLDFYDVQYQIGDAEPVTVTMSTHLESGVIEEFEIGGLKIDTDGQYEIKVSITDLDGNADEYINDNSLSTVINCLTNLATRKVLLENFSTAQCVNCPRVHEWIHNILADRDDVAWVVHHAGYNTDSYTIKASRDYLSFYPGSGTFAPAVMLDRTLLSDQGATTGSSMATTPIFLPTSESSLEEYIDYCASQPAFVSLNIEDAYDESSRELIVKVSGEAMVELTEPTFMNVFVTESGMVNYQSGGGNNYVHNNAIRATMSSTWGDEITYNEDGTYEVTYKLTLKDAWYPENMDIVAFISNFNKEDVNDCVVLNTEFKELNYDASVSNINSEKCNVWTAGKTVCINGHYDNAQVYTMDGRLIKSVNDKQCFNLDQTGIYIVIINGNATKIAIK